MRGAFGSLFGKLFGKLFGTQELPPNTPLDGLFGSLFGKSFGNLFGSPSGNPSGIWVPPSGLYGSLFGRAFGNLFGGPNSLAQAASEAIGLALRMGVHLSTGKPIFARQEGKCSPLTAGFRDLGLVMGVHHSTGKPIVAWSDQRCDPDTDTFEVGRRYLGLVMGVHPTTKKPIVVSWCKRCGPDEPNIVDCNSCDRPRTINLEVTQGATLRYSGTMTWNNWIDIHCDCFLCHEDLGLPDACEALCAEYTSLPDFHGFCRVDDWCYACYSALVTGYVSDDWIPIYVPHLAQTRNFRLVMVCVTGSDYDGWWMFWWDQAGDFDSYTCTSPSRNNCSVNHFNSGPPFVTPESHIPPTGGPCGPLDFSFSASGPSFVLGDVIATVWEDGA